ncbi:MAG: hypothetical protein K8L99_14060 [Anaerolineae bacterium]|nr:hypothetical protein [Anaerolineae bacterium]
MQANSLNAGRDINLVQNNVPLPKLPIDGLDEKRGKADWSLLSKLWSLVNTEYIDHLDQQTQLEMIEYDEYVKRVYGYIELRQQPQNTFHHPKLEQAFNDFDVALTSYTEAVRPAFTASRLNGTMWYLSEKKEARLDHHWLSDEAYQIVQQRHDDYVQQSILLLKQSKKLAGEIRRVVPDFFAE